MSKPKPASIPATASFSARIDDVVRQFPGTATHLRAPDGGVHRFVNVYLNDEDVRFLDGLETAVREGDVVTVLPAVAGGAR